MPEEHNWGTDVPNEIVGRQSHAYIIKHLKSHTIISLWWEYTEHQVQWHYYFFDSVSARAVELGADGLANKLCGGERLMLTYINHPILNTIDFLAMEYTDIRYSDITTCIDSVSARGAQLEDGWSPNELCCGRSHAYIIKHHWNTIDSLWWNTLISGTSDITTCIDSVSARKDTTGDGWSPNELCGGEQSHAYIIKHPISTQLTPCDGIHWHQVQWHYYIVIDSVSARAGELGDGWSQMNCVRESQSHGLHNIQQQSQHNWLLVMEYTDISTVDITILYWFCECQRSTTGGRMVSKWIVWGRAVSCLHNQAPNWNTIGLLAMEIHWHQVQWHYYCIICECQSCTTGDGWSSNEFVWGEQSHAYIISTLLKHNWLPCDGIANTDIRYSDITTCVLICECQSSTTGGRMVSKWIVWGEQSHSLHNQASNLNTIELLCERIH